MWLFGLDPDSIVVTVHRQSILHSGVEFKDGALLAQLGVPDMRLPIQYALTYPERMECSQERLTIEKMAELTFERPDYDTFECLAAGTDRFLGLVPDGISRRSGGDRAEDDGICSVQQNPAAQQVYRNEI